MSDSFWKFRASDKWDVIDNDSHPKLVVGALSDQDTGVEEIDRNTFLLFGPEESLLWKTDRHPFMRVAVHLYASLVNTMRR